METLVQLTVDMSDEEYSVRWQAVNTISQVEAQVLMLIELNGSATAAASGTSVEELIFDGASGEAIVRATGIASLTTLKS